MPERQRFSLKQQLQPGRWAYRPFRLYCWG